MEQTETVFPLPVVMGMIKSDSGTGASAGVGGAAAGAWFGVVGGTGGMGHGCGVSQYLHHRE